MKLGKKGWMIGIVSLTAAAGALILILTLTYTPDIGGQMDIGKTQIILLKSASEVSSVEYSLLDSARIAGRKAFILQAKNGGYYKSECVAGSDYLWDFKKCKPDYSSEFKKYFLEEYLRMVMQLKKHELFNELLKEFNVSKIDVKVSGEGVYVDTGNILVVKKDNFKYSLKPEFEVDLNADLRDYESVYSEVRGEVLCLREGILNGDFESCFKESKFEYKVFKDRNLIKFEVKLDKIMINDVEEVIVKFVMNADDIKEEAKTVEGGLF